MLPATGLQPDVFERLLQIVAPNPQDHFAVLEAYFDESATHSGAPILTVGGYLFTSEGAAKLHRRWSNILKARGLPYFHMVDNTNGAAPFDRLSKDERIVLQTRLIGLIKNYALFGFAVSVQEDKFWKIFPSTRFLPNPYSFCCWLCVHAVHSWLLAKEHSGPVSFFFEAGYKHQNDASELMSRVFNQSFYASHTFIKKESCGAIQAADVVAYLHNKYIKDMKNGAVRFRADFQALLAGPDYYGLIVDEDRIYDVKDFHVQRAPRLPPLNGLSTGQLLTPWSARLLDD